MHFIGNMFLHLSVRVGLHLGMSCFIPEKSGAMRKFPGSFVTPPKRSKRVENDPGTTTMPADLSGWLSELFLIVLS